MKAAIVTTVCLAALGAFIQHGSACPLNLERVSLGCSAFRFVSTPRRLNVCGQKSTSCQTNGVGIIDGSVRVQHFEVPRQCKIYGPYRWYNRDPLFYGIVNGAYIVLTGRQRDINGQEQDFKGTVQVNTRGYISAKIDATECVKGLSSRLSSMPHREKFQEILSENSRKTLFNQLHGALSEMVSEIISSAPNVFG